jgi:tRNA(Ile)-lysidine synthetase-like protein
MSKTKNEQKAFVINSLVGLYFISFIGKDVNWQGLVIGETESAWICQLFSWVVGEPTDTCPADVITLDASYADRLVLRNYREGDRIMLRGVRRQVRKLMSEKKIPIAKRRKLPIITDGENVLWIPTLAAADKIKSSNGGVSLAYYKK